MRLEGLDTVRIFRVVKSNSSAFPIGLELRDPDFATVLARLTEGHGTTGPSLPIHTPAPQTEPELLDAVPALALVPPAGPTLADLLIKADEYGFSRAQLITAARHYCGGKDDLERLNTTEIAELDRRLSAHAGRRQSAPAEAESAETTELAAASGGRERRSHG